MASMSAEETAAAMALLSPVPVFPTSQEELPLTQTRSALAVLVNATELAEMPPQLLTVRSNASRTESIAEADVTSANDNEDGTDVAARLVSWPALFESIPKDAKLNKTPVLRVSAL